jgi:Golgi apparatus protein 1
VKLSHVLLCLEGVIKNEGVQTVNGECIKQMAEHRRMLMQDFSISPEIVEQCKDDIKVCV